MTLKEPEPTNEPEDAMGYARVSSVKQAVEGESLELQAAGIARGIVADGCKVFPEGGVYQEPFTGTTDDRPVYQEALRVIRANPGKVKYFYIKTIDRFSREGALAYQQMKIELAKEGVQLRDIGGVIQPNINALEHYGFEYSFSVWSPSSVGEVAIAEAVSQERSRILSRLIEAEIKLTQDGYHLGRANDGYIVKRIHVDGKKKLAQFPDPERGHFLRTMFDLRAGGTTSDKEIVAHLNQIGYRKRPFQKWNKLKTIVIGQQPPMELTVKHLQVLLQDPIYCGVTIRKWTHYKAIRAQGGEPLISVALFNAANRGKVLVEEREDGSVRVLHDHQEIKVTLKRHKFSPRWAFKNIVVCPHCRKPLWASSSRGRSGAYFSAYHCARTHARYSIPQLILDEAFSAYLDALRFEPRFFECFAILLTDAFHKACETWRAETVMRHSTVTELEEQQRQLVRAFTAATTRTMQQALESQVVEVEAAIASIAAGERMVGTTEVDLERFLSKARNVLEHPKKILENVENFQEQVSLYSLFFEQFPTYEEIASGTASLRLTMAAVFPRGGAESCSVGTTGLDWNLIQAEIDRWKEASWAIDVVLERIRARDVMKAA